VLGEALVVDIEINWSKVEDVIAPARWSILMLEDEEKVGHK
jgi:hypothetical protein